MNKAFEKNIHKLTRRAYAHLLWEVYAPVFALALCITVLFIIGATSGLWQLIGDPWRGLALLISIGFVIKSTIKAHAKIKPGLSQARRRVEQDNGMEHRPFDTIHDRAAQTKQSPDENDQTWQVHMNRAQALVGNARPSKLRAALAPLDPYYIRFALPFVLLIGIMVGAGDNYERLRTSLTPTWISGISDKNARFEAWIDPPEYTRRPPSYFKNTNTLNVPEGSEFVARISGVKSAPRLIIKEGKRTRRITPKRLGPKSFEARVILSSDATASYRIASTSQIWRMTVTKDLPPLINFDTPPSPGKRDKLIFTYSLEDDYGTQNLALSFHLKNDPKRTEQISIALPGSSVRTAQEEPAALDLTKHKWAGKEVVGHLIATDGKGQSGLSKTASFIIPDKIFVEPLAKAVAEQRLLVLNGTDIYKASIPTPVVTLDDLGNRPVFNVDRPDKTIERAPAQIQRSAILIAAVTDRPIGVYEDPTVYMGLRNIYGRLRTARGQDDLKGIPEDLWTIALRAEFGLLGDALEDMRAAERALNNAMARRAPQREVDTLFDRYNAAVDRYMEELTLKAIEEAKNRAGGSEGSGGGGDNFNTDEIQKLLDAIEEANRLGDTVAARKALAQLAQLLENMQIQLAQGQGSGDGPSDGGMSEEVKKALEELNELLGEQRQLRDETQDSARAEADQQAGGEGQADQGQEEPGQSGSDLATEQERLAELLGALEQGIGENIDQNDGTAGRAGDEEDGEDGGGGEEIKQALKDARGAMRESEEALENGQYYRAGRAQSDAIEALRQAGEGLFAQEASRLGEQNANADGQADPFGREDGGNGVGDGVEVPEIDDQQRARELLEELRRRAGEQNREKIERDYLDRLLERF